MLTGMALKKANLRKQSKSNKGYQMKLLEDIAGRHKGKEIWVVGAGPSLGEFPKNFFDDKISIGCNAAWTAWNVTYIHFWHHLFMELILQEDPPSLFKKAILAYPVERWSDKWWPGYLQHVTWMVWACSKGEDITRENIRAVGEGRFEDSSYSIMGTVIHAGIYIAAVLGAKQITLCGCEHTYKNSSEKADSHAPQLAPYMRGSTDIHKHQDLPNSRMQLHRFGTWLFATEFRKYGIDVLRFYYPSRYEAITDKNILPREKKWDVI